MNDNNTNQKLLALLTKASAENLSDNEKYEIQRLLKELDPGPISDFTNGDPFELDEVKRLENDILEFVVLTPNGFLKMKIDGNGNLSM